MTSPQNPSLTPPSLLSPADLPFAASTFDRDAVERERRDLRADVASDPQLRVLVMAGGLAPVRDGALVLLDATEAPPVLEDPRHPEVYLGRLAQGKVPVVLRTYPQVPQGSQFHRVVWEGLRVLGRSLESEDTSLLVTAQAIAHWHQAHPLCPECGATTSVIRSGWARQCPQDESLHFPRTDPAIIVAVTDGNPDPEQERILLGRSSLWQGNRYSTLAGFVEPGESVEQAVIREVFEESGVRIGQVFYQGSQPWPFPRSLMLGFRAVAESVELVPDGEEIVDLKWFTRAELMQVALEQTVVLPGKISIAHALIVSWLGHPLPQSAW